MYIVNQFIKELKQIYNIRKIMIGKKVRELREKLGYSQQGLAVAIHVGRATISRIECGKSEPSQKTLKKLASALNTSQAYLLGEGKRPEILRFIEGDRERENYNELIIANSIVEQFKRIECNLSNKLDEIISSIEKIKAEIRKIDRNNKQSN